jgi:hypothetical protein
MTATLSDAVGSGNRMEANAWPLDGCAATSAGQAIVGGWVSATETVNEQELCKKALSVAVHDTMVVDAPLKIEPEGGSHVMFLIPEASEAAGVYEREIVFLPTSGTVLIFPGHVMSGFVVS